MSAAVENSQVADETVAALGQMDSSGVKGSQNSLKKARQAEKTFRENLARESANVNAADQALDSARKARIQNMNPDTIAAEKKALQNRSKAMEKWNDARQKHLEAQQAVADARTELQDVQEAAVNQARTEALGKQQERQEIKKVDYAVQQQNVDANIQQVAQMDSVVTLNGEEFAAGGTDLKQQVAEYFDSLGGVVANPVLGDVSLTRRGAKNSISHGIGNEKAVAFAAVPSVIENGQIVDVQQNWKGRGYDTFVIAAPVTIEGGQSAGEYYCGVVVKRASDTQQYYVHEVLLTNNEGANVAVQPTVRPNESSVALGGAKAPSVNSILQKVIDVKKQNMEGAETLYADKNRADSWSRSTRLKLPIGEDTIGSVDSIPQNTGTVNSSISDSAANDSGQGNSSQGISQQEEQQQAPILPAKSIKQPRRFRNL